MKLPSAKPKELVRVLNKLGCIQKRQTGSHRIFYYPKNHKIIPVPIHNKDLKKGLLYAVVKELDLSVDEFTKLLKK